MGPRLLSRGALDSVDWWGAKQARAIRLGGMQVESGPIVDVVCSKAPLCRRDILESTLTLAVEVAQEGREGHRVGALLTLGSAEAVLGSSRPLILDRLSGHPPAATHITDRRLRGTIKELVQLDGAFVLADDGIVQLALAIRVAWHVGAPDDEDRGRRATLAQVGQSRRVDRCGAVPRSPSSLCPIRKRDARSPSKGIGATGHSTTAATATALVSEALVRFAGSLVSRAPASASTCRCPVRTRYDR